MLKQKFEMKSAKVKAMCFHPQRLSFLAVGLFTGETQVWDFRSGHLVSEFKDSEQCIRAVDFHPIKSLLAAGGDDTVIKGYDTSANKKAFELKGHIDFVRTVVFHAELPWLLSAADDQTLRLWNWQSKAQMTVLTGHDHYVMCARFHPAKDLIVSAALDSTFRLWNFAKLKSKFSSSHGSVFLFANDVDAVLSREAHAEGVNWVDFHPSEDLLATCSDDKLVKLWRFGGSQAVEEQALHGHTHNVSCVAFLADGSRLLSNAEDGTLRVWSLQGVMLQRLLRPGEKLWALAVHPRLPYAGIGGDSSFALIGLAPDKVVARRVLRDSLVVNWAVRARELEVLAPGAGRLGGARVLAALNVDLERWSVSRVAVNPFAADQRQFSGVLQLKLAETSERRLVTFSLDLRDFSFKAAFAEGDRLAFLGAGQALLKHGKKRSLCAWPGLAVQSACELDFEECFEASPGTALLAQDASLRLYSFADGKMLWRVSDEDFAGVKAAVWSPGRGHVAILARHCLHLLDKHGRVCASAKEDSRVKSALWALDAVLYNTHEHVKYLLRNGDGGIVCTTQKAVFLARSDPDCLWALDGEGGLQRLEVDLTEVAFKVAVAAGDGERVRQLMADSRFLGQSMTAYLLGKGRQSLALQLCGDKALGFEFALGGADLSTAHALAAELGDQALFRRLGEKSAHLGALELAEKSLKLAEDVDALPVLLAVAGKRDELRKLLREESGKSLNDRFADSLCAGDARERVRVLVEAGLHALAFAAARAHGLGDIADSLLQSFPELREVEETRGGELLTGPLFLRARCPDLFGEARPREAEGPAEAVSEEEGEQSFGLAALPAQPRQAEEGGEVDAETAWNIESVDAEEEEPPAAVEEEFKLLRPREDELGAQVRKHSLVAWKHFCVGDVEGGKSLLLKQIGVRRLGPLSPLVLELTSRRSDPLSTPYTPAFLAGGVEAVTKLLLKAQFRQASERLTALVQQSVLADVASAEEELQLVETRKELLRMRTAIEARQSHEQETDPQRRCVLALVMGHAQLAPALRLLFLQVAINSLYKAQNYLHALYLIRKLLQVAGEAPAGREELAAKMKGMLKACEAKGGNRHAVEFREKSLQEAGDEERVDFRRLEFIAAKSEAARCPLDNSHYAAPAPGEVCLFCGCCEIGFGGTGLRLRD